jgi:hypothetical protein
MKLKKQQQMIIGGVLLLLVLIGGGVFAWMKMQPQKGETLVNEPKKKKTADPVNVLAVPERPYIQISPIADGRNLELIIKSLNKPATSVEYELEYQAGSLLQGAFGEIELGTVPAQAKILLGSCSAGGACTYHEDVKGGTLLTRFDGAERYALKSDWRYFDNRAKATEFASKDAKFQLTSKELTNQRYLIVFNTPGYPAGMPGTAISDPYSLAGSNNLKGTGNLTIRANEEAPGATIVGWNGTAWQEFPTTADGKTLTAEVDLMELYVAVKK